MKRFILFLLAVSFCILTSCSMNKTGEVSFTDTIKESPEPKKKNPSEICVTYEESLNKLFDSFNNDDVKSVISLSYPDEYYDSVKIIAAKNNISIEKMFREMYIPEMKNIRLTEIVSAEPLKESDIDLMDKAYSNFQSLSVYTAGYERLETMSYNEKNPFSFEPDESLAVNCVITYTDKYGVERNDTAEIWLYYIDGEGWKADMSFMGYIKNSMQKNINSDVLSLYTASCSILNKLDSNNYAVPLETLIISSDDSMDINVSREFAERFRKELADLMEEYFPEHTGIEYFVVLEGGRCEYTAGFDNENPEYTGTCPPGKVFTSMGPECIKENFTYIDLYEICLDEIN